MRLPHAVRIGDAHLQDAPVAVDVLDRRVPRCSSSSCGYGRVLERIHLRLVGERPFGAVGIDARAHVERARVERARDVRHRFRTASPACAGSTGSRPTPATSVAWMLPSTQNAGLSAAGPVAALVTVDDPDVASFVALADRLDRDEIGMLARERSQELGQFGVAIEAVEGDGGHAQQMGEGGAGILTAAAGARELAASPTTVYPYGILDRVLPPYAELHCLSQFLVPARRVASRGARRARPGAGLCGARDHRRMLGGGRRARAPRGEGRRAAARHRQRVHARRRH